MHLWELTSYMLALVRALNTYDFKVIKRVNICPFYLLKYMLIITG